MKSRTIALIFLIIHLAVLLFICATWFKYNRDISENGGEMADGIFVIALFIATLYYFALTVWTFIIFKKTQQNQKGLEVQLATIFVLGILTMIVTLYKLYF